jgi:hypothetical protein
MAVGPSQAIADLTCAPGELSFEARIGGASERVWLRTDAPFTPTADAALAACLMPAMRSGGTLKVDAPVSPRILRSQREFQAIQLAWSLDWGFGEMSLQEVEVIASARQLEAASGKGRVAAFFSGGVDSWSTVIANPDITDLIFVRGFDLVPGAVHQAELAGEVEGRLGEAAQALGLPLHRVETNLRHLSDPLLVWDTYFGCAVSAVALFLAPLFERVLIAGDSDFEVQAMLGANHLVDQLWSTERLEIVDDGGRRSRMERLRAVAGHPVARRTLRVCWENRGGAYNCGHCRKCLMTMSGLEAIGALDQVETFPAELDLEAVAAIRTGHQVLLTLWEDLLDATRESGRPELESAVGEAVAASRRELGLPPGYRRRHRAAPPSLLDGAGPRAGGGAGSAPPLFATPATAKAIAAASAVVVLVGGYDGSGNYGDILQLDAALELLGPLQPELLVLPMLERSFAASHRILLREMLHPPEHVVFFDAGGEHSDELAPVSPADGLDLAACYLYGGGYVNGQWGDRKLAMLGAAEALLDGGGPGRIRRVSSGIQADGEWIGGLPSEQAELLRSFEPVGVRDPQSASAFEQLWPCDVLETADDAVGILKAIPPRTSPPGPGAPLEINVHYAEHSWMTGEPAALLDFYAEFIASLGRAAGAPLLVRPVIAYLDLRVDERPAVSRLAGALTDRGIAVAEPLVMRPAGVEELAARMQRALLTLSTSYHVALTSLMLGVPAVPVQGNPYFAQKAAGLLDAFALPPFFTAHVAADAAASAGRVADVLLAERSSAELHAGLARASRSFRRRRGRAEAELLARLRPASGAPGFSSTAVRNRAMARRLRVAEEEAWSAVLRAADAEADLSEMLSSRSWRLSAPLRSLSALLRRPR